MRQKMVRSIAVALSIGCVAGFVAISVGVANVSRKESPAVLTFPQAPNDSLLWPMRNAWIWNITEREPDVTGKVLRLICRVIEHDPAKTKEELVTTVRRIAKEKADQEFDLGAVGGLDPKDIATVAVQVVDLGEVGQRKDDHPLRLLVRIQGKNVSSGHFGELEGKTLKGAAIHGQRSWKDGELHLLNLYTREGDVTMIYDIVARIE